MPGWCFLKEQEKKTPSFSPSLEQSSAASTSSLSSLAPSHLLFLLCIRKPPPPPPQQQRQPDLHPAHPGSPRRHPVLPGPLRPRLRGRVALGLGRHQAARLARPPAGRAPPEGPAAHLLPGECGHDGDEAAVPQAAGAAPGVRGAGPFVPRVGLSFELFFFSFLLFRWGDCLTLI